MNQLLKRTYFVAFSAALFLGACDSDKFPVNPVVKDSVSFASDIQPILTAQCVPCHNPAGEQPDPDLRKDYAYESLMSLEEGAIIPGNAEESELVEMLEWAEGSDNPMPPAGKMSQLNIELVKKWIDEGALNN